MSSQRNTGAFVFGSVVGGLVGAAITLWTTPKSGAELRSSISSGKTGNAGTDHEGMTESGSGQRFSNPILGFVERVAAPIVGVDLGKQAKDDPETLTATPVRRSSADARPPAPPASADDRLLTSEPEPPTTSEESTSVGVTDTDVTDAHAATAEDLTTPPKDYVERLKHGAGSDTTDEPSDFPDLPSKDHR